MSDASWYQRAVARARGQEPQRSFAPSYPQPQPQVSQQGYTTGSTSAGNVNWTPQMQPQPAGSNTGQKLGQASTSDLLQMQAATGQATPGIGHQLNPHGCPACGANLFYEKLTRGPRRGPEPAPHCFSCGYNGLFEQGLAGNWGAA